MRHDRETVGQGESKADDGKEGKEAEQVKEEMIDTEKLTAKEKRLYDYLRGGGDRKIGAICDTLKTTPITLISKTMPGLKRKRPELFEGAQHGTSTP